MLQRFLHSSDSNSDSDEEINRRRRKIYKTRINFTFQNNFQFEEAFRLIPSQVEYELDRIGGYIEPVNGRNKALSAKQQLLVCLHWLGNGAQFHGVAQMHGISKSSVCRIVEKVVTIIINTMLANTVCWPANIENIARAFFRKGGFPLVCGAVDGTLINIDAPPTHEEVYVDRYGKHSLNVMCVCGPNYVFYAVNANWPGSVHDSRVLRNSAVFERFEGGYRPFPGAVILADSAYPLKTWLIPPLRRNPDANNERRFNIAHKITSKLIEDSYGILKEKFPCLNYLRMLPEKAAKIVIACCILHNIARTIDRDDDDNDEIYNVCDNLNEDDDVLQNENGENDVNAQETIENFLRFFN